MEITLSPEGQAIEQLFYLQNKSGKRVKFKLNQAQRMLDSVDNPSGRVRCIIAKARQKGFSQGVLGKFAVRCLGVEGTHAVVISHETNATQRLLDRVTYLFKYINGPKPTFGFNSRKEMSFPVRDATYFIGTAGSRRFGRGDWITDLHCSEYAWWDSPEDHIGGLFQAVPYEGRIYIESTGNGKNNDFYHLWENAASMGYTKLFFAWYDDNEYELDIDTSWKPDFPGFDQLLLDLQSQHSLNDRKMAWYEMKLKELRGNLMLMRQEYPSTPEECFQATGGTIFEEVKWTPSPDWISEYKDGYYINKHNGHPKPGWHYVLGADPSGGTGHDDTAIVIFCTQTGEQVYELAHNTVNPLRCGELISKIASEYNDAFVVCESNNHGAAVIPYLVQHYKKEKLFKRRYATRTSPPIYGWSNSETNKHALVGLMQEDLQELTFYGIQTVKELQSFEETAEGKLTGTKDDLVIAAGLGMMGMRRFAYLREEYMRPKQPIVEKVRPNYMSYTLEEVLDNISKRRRSLYERDQSGQGYPN